MALNRRRVAASDRTGQARRSCRARATFAARPRRAGPARARRRRATRRRRRAPPRPHRSPRRCSSTRAPRRRDTRPSACRRARARCRRSRRPACAAVARPTSSPSTPNTVPLSARIAALPSAIADSGCSVPMPATCRATGREQLLGRRRARAVQQHVALVDEAGADEHLRDLADHLIAHREDHDLGLEQDVGRRRRERRDARRSSRRRAPAAAARPQPEHRHAAEAQRAGERGRDRTGADDERGGVARGHRYKLVLGDIPQDRPAATAIDDAVGSPVGEERADARRRDLGHRDAGRGAARRQREAAAADDDQRRARDDSSQRYHFVGLARGCRSPITSRSCVGRCAIERGRRDRACGSRRSRAAARAPASARLTFARGPSGAAASSHIAIAIVVRRERLAERMRERRHEPQLVDRLGLEHVQRDQLVRDVRRVEAAAEQRDPASFVREDTPRAPPRNAPSSRGQRAAQLVEAARRRRCPRAARPSRRADRSPGSCRRTRTPSSRHANASGA